MTRRPALLLAALLLAACAGPPPPPAPVEDVPEEASPLRRPTAREVRRLAALAEVTLVGVVERRAREPGGVHYDVRVQEVLTRHDASAPASPDTHPVAAGAVVRVSTFLVPPSGPRPGEIGRLDELGRYLFFLAPAEDPGEWFHVDDAAGYPLPEAQPTLEELRGLRGAAGPSDAPPAREPHG